MWPFSEKRSKRYISPEERQLTVVSEQQKLAALEAEHDRLLGVMNNYLAEGNHSGAEAAQAEMRSLATLRESIRT